jgi:competence protein ComFC
VLEKYFETLVGIVFPLNCCICKKHLGNRSREPLCPECLKSIEKNLPPFCAKCGVNLKETEIASGVCLACRKKNYHFKRAWSATLYKGAMEELVHLFKYRNKSQLARPLSRLMIDFMQHYNLALKGFDMLAAVPLHTCKLREREYNQAQLLAEHISLAFRIPLSAGNLRRLRPTRPQSSINRQSRFDNVADAFTLKNPQEFKDKRVLLIDDLLTTGATCSEVARVLNAAQASSVYVLTLSIAQ